MSPRVSKTVACVVLLVCLLCPIFELFDRWDHTAETGNDTECALVIAGLCVGVAYAFARLVLASPIINAVSEVVLHLFVGTSLVLGERSFFFVVPIPLSPPDLALRI